MWAAVARQSPFFMQTEVFLYNQPFTLQSGITLSQISLAYSTWGTNRGDNVVWIFHALTANSRPDEWWPGLVGKDKFFNPEAHFIICVNMPGSPYGSISPITVSPDTDQPWHHTFPQFTINDMVRTYTLLRDHLGIREVKLGIGGSMGGQQLLEWATLEPSFFKTIVPLATNAQHSAWGIAFNATQRMCLESDETWGQPRANAAQKGLAAARAVAMLSYRSYNGYAQTQTGFSDAHNIVPELAYAESYQRYQAKKLVQRFNAYSYWHLSRSMDLHWVGKALGTDAKAALQRIQSKAVVIAISSDGLFPPQEQAFIADAIRDSIFFTIDSIYGHDGFLIESEAITKILQQTQALGYTEAATIQTAL